MMSAENARKLDETLTMAKKLIYDKCGFRITNVKHHVESAEYGGCSFELDGKKILYRASKTTPTKIGQFVTIWKRNINGTTMPFDVVDDFDFVIISSARDGNFGQFIFPKSVLADKGIITANGKDGKRGIRVYPPWDVVNNRQAIKTQNWQTKYFVSISDDVSAYLNLLELVLKI